MRLASLCLVGVLASTGLAQFPGGTTPPRTPQPASVIPAMPATATPPSAHPWYIKPEVGQWVICVKSYMGERAKINAEALATDIRERYKVPAYLFERGSEERRKEEERYAREVERKRAEEAAQFKDLMAKLRAEAAAKGVEFIEPRPNIIVPHVKYQDQYAVLIGGWPTMEAARKALDTIRRWEAPANKLLLDSTSVVNVSKEGKATGEQAFINPFQVAMVTRNPLAPMQMDAEGEADVRLTQKLNQNEELSVLKIQKPWTIVVKQFTPPQEVKGHDVDRSMLDRIFKPQKDVMIATAEHAISMAKMLRSMKPTERFPKGIEAYVLHTKNGSLVCVGQFNSADDPELMQAQQQLGMLKFDVAHDDKNPNNIKDREIRLFDRLYAMKVK